MIIDEDDFLLISGIQHFAFCRRQWALIHIEQQWQENLRTVEGNIFHEKAHNKLSFEKRRDVLITRGLPVSSKELGLFGVCDVVEFHENENGIELYGHKGKFIPVPVEYKRGSPKRHNADKLQLCAQALCLEEMFLCRIHKGFLYYGDTKHRFELNFDNNIRNEVKQVAKEMHEYFRRRYTPKVRTGSFCNTCSLKDICLPKLCKSKSVDEYISDFIKEKAE